MTRGYVIPIGGAEEKVREPAILRRFAKVCGGRSARIAIIPTASELKDTGKRYEKIFEDLGVREARSLAFESRHDCDKREWLDWLESADGVFITGGNQLRLSTHLGGTKVAHILKHRNLEGVHIAGTSAGAAFVSEHMIAFGEEGPTPHLDMVTLAPGLGLTNRVIVDQHFRQRDRHGRLLTALSFNPYLIGMGLDEDTAAFIGPDELLEVHGSGCVTILDPTEMEYSSSDHARKHDPLCMIGLKLHVLTEGCTYNLHSKQALRAVTAH